MASNIQLLLNAYTINVELQWRSEVSGSEKVWFCIYDPKDERRLLRQLTNFEIATINAGHNWKSFDLTDSFGQWFAQHKYRNRYFAKPELFEIPSSAFKKALAATVIEWMESCDDNTVVALTGISSLFGLTSISRLVESIVPDIKGRLAVFFPGSKHENNYRFLDVHDGWNYLAVPIQGEV